MSLHAFNCESLKGIFRKLDNIPKNGFRRNGAERLNSKPASLLIPSLATSFVKAVNCRIPDSTVARASVSAVEALPTFVPLPLDYYKILGTTSHNKDVIEQGYVYKAGIAPEMGYSNAVLVNRLEILKGARDFLMDDEERQLYIEDLEKAREMGGDKSALMVDIPIEKVPAALCLLQECGEDEVVIDVAEGLFCQKSLIGPQFLPYSDFLDDLAISLALARVQLFQQAITLVESSKTKFLYGLNGGVKVSVGTMAEGYENLEKAQRVLQETGGTDLCKRLQKEVQAKMGKYQKDYVLDLLEMPFESPERAKGLKVFETVLLRKVEKDSSAVVLGSQGEEKARIEFFQEGLRRMTAQEQIDFDASFPGDESLELSRSYSVALALTGKGFFDSCPSLIRSGEAKLAQIRERESDLQGVNPGRFLPDDVSLEGAMCALLLGRVDDCLQRLRMDRDPPGGDLSLARFVYERSPEASGKWWDEERGLQREEGEETEVSGFATSALLPGVCSLLQWWLQECVAARFRDLAGQQVVLSRYFDKPLVIRQLEGVKGDKGPLSGLDSIMSVGFRAIENLRGAIGVGVVEGSAPGGAPGLAESLSPAEVARSRTLTELKLRNHGSLVEPRQVSEKEGGKKTGVSFSVGGSEPEGEVEEDVKEASWKVPAAVLGLLLTGGLGFALVARQSWGSGLREKLVSVLGLPGAEERILAEKQRRMAEEVVHKWQQAKAAAMGTEHQLARLEEVLEGPMLESWTRKANTAMENSWHWEFTFHHVKVEEVSFSPDGHRATLDAVVTESARMFEKSRREGKDSYNDTFTIHYDLVLTESGWKIHDGTVVR